MRCALQQIELARGTRMATLGVLTASIALVNNAGACLGWLSGENLEEARNSLVTDGA